MENKLNIAELLKDCPKGMELDCTLYENASFIGIAEGVTYPICVKINLENVDEKGWTREITLTSDGKLGKHPNAKCIIFPKGKTTWEGFVPPCEFKDGDIVISTFGDIHLLSTEDSSYCSYRERWRGLPKFDETITTGIKVDRLATEEEKQELFDAIKSNGYKWNEETKTLEKLEDIEDKGNISDGYHTFNELYEYRLLYNASMFNELAKQGLYDVHKSKLHSDGTIPFGDENWFIVQAELPTGQISNHYEMKDWDLFQVPIKEKANQYDGHTPQDVAKRLRDFLSMKKMIEPKFKVGNKIKYINGKNKDGVKEGIILSITNDTYDVAVTNDMGIFVPISEQDEWGLISDKFDISNLKPFDKVLVRDVNDKNWVVNIFGYYRHETKYPFYCSGNINVGFKQCIPYEKNEHLLGTTNDCDEFYKTW